MKLTFRLIECAIIPSIENVSKNSKIKLKNINPALNEPVCEKTNNLGSDQVQHKPGCTVTENG